MPVSKGEGRGSSEMFWEGGVSLKQNKSRSKKCEVYRFYTHTLCLEYKERPYNEDTYSVPIGGDNIGKGVAKVY